MITNVCIFELKYARLSVVPGRNVTDGKQGPRRRPMKPCGNLIAALKERRAGRLWAPWRRQEKPDRKPAFIYLIARNLRMRLQKKPFRLLKGYLSCREKHPFAGQKDAFRRRECGARLPDRHFPLRESGAEKGPAWHETHRRRRPARGGKTLAELAPYLRKRDKSCGIFSSHMQ